MYGRRASEWRRSAVAGAAVLLSVGLLGGCGAKDAKKFDELDTSKVEEAVSGFNGAMTDQTRFEQIFAPGAGPDKAARAGLGKYMFRATSVEVDGNSATCTVEISDGDSSEVVDTAEWTAEKVGDKWLIKTCPIPPTVK